MMSLHDVKLHYEILKKLKSTDTQYFKMVIILEQKNEIVFFYLKT